MSKRTVLRHSNVSEACPLCEYKLLQADPRLGRWFREKVRPRHPTAHISHSYRGEAEQNALVKLGTSKLRYPLSKHNAMQDGKPCSLAIDLFELQVGGVARWDKGFFTAIAEEAQADGEPIEAGVFWLMVDGPHFQIA